MSAIRRYLKLMTLHGADVMLCCVVPHMRQGEPRQRVVTNAEREAILAQCKLDLRVYVLFCAQLGFRAGTAIRVASRHWDRETDEIRINGLKHGASIVMPLTAELKELLLTCERLTPFAADDVPYILRARGASMNRQRSVNTRREQLTRRFRRICRNEGISDIRPHDLRRTFAEKIYNETGDLRQVQGALGHMTLRSTTHYLQRSTTAPSRALLEKVKLA